MGTDTVTALLFARKYYDAGMAGFSIPAMEHSTVTSWGRDKEVDSYRNMLVKHAKPGGLVACVSDSYDIYEACKLWGTILKQDVINSGATVVVRPDSGNPSEVVLKCLQILDQYFGSVVNDKGFKVLNNVRVIQGDGIDHSSINAILAVMHMAGYSADNVAFGQGGALLQKVDRDTMRFAMKCSAIRVNGVWRDVYKDPITDAGKKSKKGRVVLYKNAQGEYYSGVEDWMPDVMSVRFEDGDLVNQTTFDKVRANARK
jgi:nicotinamide phosphoribosyltransferase